jgi:hypothetical protein
MLFAVVFPTINSQLVELGIATPANVGKYSSSLESVTAVFNLLALVPAAWVGVRFGRKWPILAAVSAMCIVAALFGFGTTYWQLLVLRSLLGLFSAQAVITRTMIAELSTPETIVRPPIGCLLPQDADPAAPGHHIRILGSRMAHRAPYRTSFCQSSIEPGRALPVAEALRLLPVSSAPAGWHH